MKHHRKRVATCYIYVYVNILIENSACIIVVNVEWNYDDVRLLSIEPVKKTNVSSGLYWSSRSDYNLCSWQIYQVVI